MTTATSSPACRWRTWPRRAYGDPAAVLPGPDGQPLPRDLDPGRRRSRRHSRAPVCRSRTCRRAAGAIRTSRSCMKPASSRGTSATTFRADRKRHARAVRDHDRRARRCGRDRRTRPARSTDVPSGSPGTRPTSTGRPRAASSAARAPRRSSPNCRRSRARTWP